MDELEDDGSFLFDGDDGEPLMDAAGVPVVATAFLVVGQMAVSAAEVTEMEWRYRVLGEGAHKIVFDERDYDRDSVQ
jgi:hypothetical protein